MLLFFLSALLLLCFFVCCIRFDRFRIAILYALTSLCLCFPVYAEDEAYTFDSEITEFTYLQNNEIKLDQVENHIIQDEIQTQEEITAILSEPLADPSPILRSAPVNNDFTIDSYRTYSRDSAPGLRLDLSGDVSSIAHVYALYNGDSTKVGNQHFENPDDLYLNFVFPVSDFPVEIFGFRFNMIDNSDIEYPYSITINVDSVIPETEVTVVDNFILLVTSALSWFLGSFSSITSWILADSMAAVYAAIFLVGCVVAMLFRVLRSA